MKNILILDDDITFSLMLKTWLTKKDFMVNTAISVAGAKKDIDQIKPDLIISDIRLPDDDGISFLKWTKEMHPEIAFIMMTGYADLPNAVEAIRSGAYDFIAKPINPEELLKKIKAALTFIPQESYSSIKKGKEAKNPCESDYIRGRSTEYEKVYEYISLVAPTNLAVFIKGESGVGKEHMARMIHDKSKRAHAPFIPVDCGVMNKELSASEFFGHVKGSFTGAISNKKGHFVEANGGTLFLDEIGNLSVDIQMQLLRVLQEKRVKPVGATKEVDVDVRIVVATNEDMEHSVNTGKFRRDLYHRLNEFIIKIPTLSECKEDIPLFINHFLLKANQEMEKNIEGVEDEAMEALINYRWPGNIRELKNIIFRLVLIAKTPLITLDLLLDNISGIKNLPDC